MHNGDNITRSRISHMQTAQDIFNLLKGISTNYLVLTAGNGLSISNRYGPKCDFVKVKVIVKINGTIGFLALKDTFGCQNHHPQWFSQKLWSKTSFCKIVANITHSCTSHKQTAKDIFYFIESLDPSYPVLKFGDTFS